MAIKIDLIDGSSLSQRNGRIMQVVRVARVSGLSGSSDVLFDALAHAGLPDDGDAHPDYSDLYVVGHEIVPEPGGLSARVNIIYQFEPRSAPVIRGGSSTQQGETTVDRLGSPIAVDFGGNFPQIAPVSVYVSGATLIFQLAEATNTPGDIVTAWGNHTNSTTWNSYAADKWLCSDVQFEELHIATSPKVWLFTYQFMLNTPDGWQPVASAIDPSTGRPPDGATPVDVDWYEQLNFNTKFP